MIEIIVLSVFLNTGEIQALPPDRPKIERKRRNGSTKKRRRGGSGLR